MPVIISEFLLQNKKTLIIEATLLLLLPFIWSVGDKFIDAQSKTEISIVLLVQLLATLSILLLTLFVACLSLVGKIKEQNNNIDHRRNLILRWRKMVHDMATQHDEIQEKVSISTLLERHEDYYSLRPHLPNETIGQIARTTTLIAGSTISTPLKLILDDIDRLEKTWGLI